MDANVYESDGQKLGDLQFFSCLFLCNFSSGALTAWVGLRVCVRTNRVYVSIPAAWDTEEPYVCFRAAGGAGPRVNSWFPACNDPRNAVGTCGELAIRSTDVVVT